MHSCVRVHPLPVRSKLLLTYRKVVDSYKKKSRPQLVFVRCVLVFFAYFKTHSPAQTRAHARANCCGGCCLITRLHKGWSVLRARSIVWFAGREKWTRRGMKEHHRRRLTFGDPDRLPCPDRFHGEEGTAWTIIDRRRRRRRPLTKYGCSALGVRHSFSQLPIPVCSTCVDPMVEPCFKGYEIRNDVVQNNIFRGLRLCLIW